MLVSGLEKAGVHSVKKVDFLYVTWLHTMP